MKDITIADFSDDEILDEYYDRNLDQRYYEKSSLDSFSDAELEDELSLRNSDTWKYEDSKIVCDFLIDNFKYTDFPLEIKRAIEEISGKIFLS